jgi:UDP-glucuronate 4-epimerase
VKSEGRSKMGILVTGGAGFIGSHLIDKLIEKGQRVICLDNFDPYYDPKIKRRNIAHLLDNENFKLIEGDVRDLDKLNAIFERENIQKVVHLAAKVGVRASIVNALEYESVNIGGTMALLEICKDFDIENFIFGSSSSVYGVSTELPFKENGPLKPISPYGASKVAAESLCHAYHHLYNIPIVCLRFFTVYGPRQRPEMAIHKFTRLIDRGEEVEMYGDGTSKRDYTYIQDIIEGIVNALNKRFSFEIFNLGNSKPIELKQMISVIEASLGKVANIKQISEQAGDVAITYADISKARKLLGYRPKTSLRTGVEKFVAWYKKQEKVTRRSGVIR